MRFATFTAGLWLLALALVACNPFAGSQVAEPPAGPQLVTETYLRRQLDLRTAQTWALPLAEAMAGPVHRFPSRIVGVTAPTWDKDRTVELTVVLNDGPGSQRHIPMRFVFDGPDYDTGAGAVQQGACHQLPGAGVNTTGEFTTVENDTDSTDTHHISKTVTESTSSSVTLSESLELTSGVTIEAGTDAAKVSANLQSTFGISKDQTNDQAHETSDTVEDEIEVPGHHAYAIMFTTDDAGIDCLVHIGAPGDWNNPHVWIGIPDGVPLADQPPQPRWSSIHSKFPAEYTNLGLLLQGDALQDGDGGVTIDLSQADQVYRLLMGFDVRCPACDGLRFTVAARASLVKMSDKQSRWVSFEGVRHTTTRKDASYKVIDVTGQDAECVSGALSRQGVSVATLDVDGDGTLDACQER